MLFDTREVKNAPKNLIELRQWFKDLKTCCLGWSDRGPYTVGIAEIYQ